MNISSKTYTITEYGGFTNKTKLNGYELLPDDSFLALESFILNNSSSSKTEPVELLSLSARRGIGKVITAKNYVGLISLTNGTIIEILPKIMGEKVSTNDTKRIFLEMLKTLKDVSFKEFNISHLHLDRMSILEVFIKMFLDEVTRLTKQGLKSAYTTIEANEPFYKGKLVVSGQIRNNLVSKERFYVQFDEFNTNRPENRLIKTTLNHLHKLTSDDQNKRSASRLLTIFDGIDDSANIDTDFEKCIVDRSTNHYDTAISWCRVFLKGNSFTAYSGSEVALALLFPMEKVFESYIATKLKRNLDKDAKMRVQDKRFSLFDSPLKAFSLQPDIVLEINGKIVIADTKWKLLSNDLRNKGIAQSDMYQMYAYSKKYIANRVVLIYPMCDSIKDDHLFFRSDDGVEVMVVFIDLMNVDESISRSLKAITSFQLNSI